MRSSTYPRPPKTNPRCPARAHGTVSAHKAPPKGQKCECAEALAAYTAYEANRAALRGGNVSTAPRPPAPPTPSIPEVGPGDDVHRGRGVPACKGEDPELFFPVGDEGPALEQTAQAKAVCRRCPVQRPCLERALELGTDYGIWGGATEDERRELLRRRRTA